MAKFHVNLETGRVGRCDAQVKCRLGMSEDEHADNIQDARVIYENHMKETQGNFAPLQKKEKKERVEAVKNRKSVDASTDDFNGQKLSKREAEFRARFASMSADVVEMRAKLGDLSVDQDKGDPVRAQESLKNAISFATERGNTHIMEKLAKAKAMPTSVIRTNDGEKVYSDDLSDVDRAVKHIDDGRESIVNSVMNMKDAPVGKYNIKNDDGSFTVTVSDDGVNKDAFDALPEDVRTKISKSTNKLSIDLARDNLSQEEYDQVVKQSQVLDYVNGRPRDIGLKNVPVKTQFNGDTPEDKMNDSVKSLANLYGSSKKQFGKNFKELKADKTKMSATIKEAASINSKTENTYIPGRSRHNGLIVSGRQNLDHAAVKELLTDKQISSITKVSHAPDIEKAKSTLSEEDFDRIFKNRKVSLRVAEK